MVNESLLGALQSGIARGENLRKAMITLYNAGYEKKEIEEAAKILQYQTNHQTQNIQNKSDQKLSPAYLSKPIPEKQNPNQIMPENKNQIAQNNAQKIQIEDSFPRKSFEENNKQKKFIKRENRVSSYGNPPSEEATQVQREILSALQNLKNIKIPSKIQFVNPKDSGKNMPPTVIQKISGYGKPPKQVSKFATAMLVTLLIILLGTLITVFFFKEELIIIFNNFNLK